MLEIIKQELREGEKLLWSASPESFETLDLTHKTHFIKRAILICGIVGALCVLYIAYALSKGIALKPALVIIAVVCAVIASFSFLSDAKKIRRATYAVTDQRLIMAIDLIKCVDYNNIKEVQFKSDADGHVSLLCGVQTIGSKPYQWRSLTVTDPYFDPETGICERFSFYAVPDAENLKDILSNFLPL